MITCTEGLVYCCIQTYTTLPTHTIKNATHIHIHAINRMSMVASMLMTTGGHDILTFAVDITLDIGNALCKLATVCLCAQVAAVHHVLMYIHNTLSLLK